MLRLSSGGQISHSPPATEICDRPSVEADEYLRSVGSHDPGSVSRSLVRPWALAVHITSVRPSRGVEWMGYTERMPLPRPLANIRREIAEKKWEEARSWSEKRVKKKYKLPGKMREQDGGTRAPAAGRAVPSAQNRALPHRTIHEMGEERGHGGVRVVSVQDTDTEPPVQRPPAMEFAAENSVGRGSKSCRKGKNRFKIRDLLADERCTQDSLRTTGVGSRVGPRAVSLKPDEEPTEEGDGGAAENGSKDQEEDEELEGKRGANAREE